MKVGVGGGGKGGGKVPEESPTGVAGDSPVVNPGLEIGRQL